MHFFFLFCALIYSQTIAAAQRARKLPPPQEIIRLGEKQMRGRSAQSKLLMRIERPSYTRILSLRTWSVGSEKALVEILEPSKEEGVASLRVDNQMWNFLPKIEQVIRVPTSLMLQSWMGSDLSNDDLMKASSLSRDYYHRLLRVEKLNGEPTVLIDCLPKANAPVVWGKVRYWARISDFLPVKQSFFDDRRKLVRTIEFSRFKKMDHRIIPTVIRVSKPRSKERTSVMYQSVLFDREIPDSQFEKDSIRAISQAGKVLTAGWFLTPRMR